MVNSFGNLLAEELIKRKIATPDTIRGCNPQEIDELKKQQGVQRLPQLYVEYLLTMGKRAGMLDVGTDCFYPTLLKLKEWANILLEENDQPFDLPLDAFVFWMHQGYQFLYFLTESENNNPPVLYYTEDPKYVREMPQTRYRHLSEFLSNFIADVENEETQQVFLQRWPIRR